MKYVSKKNNSGNSTVLTVKTQHKEAQTFVWAS